MSETIEVKLPEGMNTNRQTKPPYLTIEGSRAALEATQQAIAEALQRVNHPRMDTNGFVECAACAAKPGSHTLCASCLQNHATIERLTLQQKEVLQPQKPQRREWKLWDAVKWGAFWWVRTRHAAPQWDCMISGAVADDSDVTATLGSITPINLADVLARGEIPVFLSEAAIAFYARDDRRPYTNEAKELCGACCAALAAYRERRG